MPYLTMSDSSKIYCEEHGRETGETVLFCHGLNSSHLKIGKFIGEFKGEFHTVCVSAQRDTSFPETNRVLNYL